MASDDRERPHDETDRAAAPTDATGVDGELREGIARTRRYLLSHHEPSEWHHCYAVPGPNGRVRVCARCLGVYPGIALGVAVQAGVAAVTVGLGLIALLPLPALVDWSRTAFTDADGSNVVRTATGLLLGVGYGAGVVRLLALDLWVVPIGVGYALLAGALLWRERGVSTLN